MSPIQIYLFSFLMIFGIAIQFADSTNNNTICDQENPAGSEAAELTKVEKILGKSKEKIKDILGKIHNGKKKFKDDTSNEKLPKMMNLRAIFPGTLWCGDGNITTSEEDLGFFPRTDACCRKHDECKNDIKAGETKQNLVNDGFFTRSDCSCDDEFHTCLKAANTIISKLIGETYFSFLQLQCLQCICSTNDCNGDDNTQCKDECKKYEWRSNPRF